jgi:phosphoserine phosphatase
VSDPLPSWRDGPTKQAILGLLDRVDEIAPGRRVAVFDNDGTLWCEKPNYIQLDFLVAELRAGVAQTPELVQRPEYRAVLERDKEALGSLGIARVASTLIELFDGIAPEVFDERVRAFFASAQHVSGRPYPQLVYQPMVELIQALRAVGVVTYIVSGGGTEFVRAVSNDLYGIPAWHVVGTTITYDVDDVDGVPTLRRTARILGDPNEGDVKVSNMRLHLGTRPIVAGGNSAGDARMLDYVQGADRDGLALLVDHDDAGREYAYASVAGTFDAEPILETAARRQWAVVSMRDDWTQVFSESTDSNRPSSEGTREHAAATRIVR